MCGKRISYLQSIKYKQVNIVHTISLKFPTQAASKMNFMLYKSNIDTSIIIHNIAQKQSNF